MKQTFRELACASLVAAQLGCGGLRDATNGDASDGWDAAAVDASVVDAAPMVGPISIEVYKPGAADPGAMVVVVAPDGTEQLGTADASGKASFAAVVAGSTVHVLNASATTLTTTMEVKPGDKLVYNKKTPPAPTSLGAMTLTAQGYPYQPDRQFQVVAPGCVTGIGDYNVQDLTIYIGEGCNRFDVVLKYANVGSPQQPDSFSYTKDLTFQAAQGTTLSQVVTDRTWKAASQLQISFMNQPGNVKSTSGHISRFVNNGANQGSVNNNNIRGLTFNYPAVATPSVTAELPDLPMPLRFVGTMANFSASLKNQVHVNELTPDARSVDFSTTALPWITQPVLTAANRQVSWTTDGAGTPTMKITKLSYKLGSPAVDFSWFVIAPGNAETKQILPTLPAQFLAQDFTQATGAAPIVSERLLRFNAGLEYDQVRGDAAIYLPNLLSEWSSDVRVTEVTISGE